ncbi:MAG: tryptophan-rich sensory protein [Caldilineae bacterium]|nr:tryptophan-rich sensory protein [Chloroflexota bacterium]MCB9176904.1 tryptophan-rich sensory protein [Caldilineae bacterium]
MTPPPAHPDAGPFDLLRQILVPLALAVTLYVNYLANALPINGRTPAEISDSFPSLVTPAGYVFAIWGLIYLALIAYAIYQAAPSRRASPLQRRVGWLFVLSCVFNSGWIFAFHYGHYRITELVMLGLLLTLIAIYLRLGTGRRPPADRLEAWALRLPFSLYLGWITIATIANTTILLLDEGWGGWGLAPEVWAVLVLMVGAGINAAIAYRHRDAVYVGVFIWAYAGIIVQHAAVRPVAITAGLMVPLVVLALLRAPRPAAAA